MNIKTYRVPEKPGEILCTPPLHGWNQVLEENRSRREAWRFRVLHVEGAELRRRVRERLWDETGERPLIVTGHQPELFHAGVWIKAFAVRRGLEVCPGAGGYHVNVDSDQVRDLGVWLPVQEGEGLLGRRWIPLGPPSPLPLERRPAPTLQEWQAFEEAGRAALETLAPGPERETLLGRWRLFTTLGRNQLAGPAAGEKAMPMARFIAECRRAWERETGATGEPLLPETYVSHVAETPEFLLFALAWMGEAERLARYYNEQLALYRRIRRHRSQANPFPNLRRYGEQVEVPFWCREPDGTRADLFVVRLGAPERLLLRTRHGDKATVDLRHPEEAVAALAKAGLALRPKAVPLTLFLRMFASDLFVHGVGGGRYDHITDGVLRAWWGVEPPEYAVVSATLPLSLSLPDTVPGSVWVSVPKEDPNYWKGQLRTWQFNPQRFVQGGEAEEPGRLKAEKEDLIRAIGRPGAPKRALTRRIEAVNEALQRHLAQVQAELTRGLREARRAQQNWSVAAARDYPFFLHDAQVLGRLVEALAGPEPGS